MTAGQIVWGVVAGGVACASLVLTLLLHRDRRDLYGGKLPFSSALASILDYLKPRNFSRSGARLVYALWVSQLMLLVSVWAFLSGHSVSREGVEAQMNRLLPVGSPAERTFQVLDSLGVPHGTDLGLDHVIAANFGVSERRFIVYWEVFDYLHFDEQDRLVRHEVIEVGTGP